MLNCPVCGENVGLSSSRCPGCGYIVDEPAAKLSPTPPDPGGTLPEGATACLNHPGRAATCSCAVCAEPFCASCVDHEGIGAVCHKCAEADPSTRRAQSGEPIVTPATKLAQDALTMSIIGILCFGIILEPIALVKAIKARGQIRSSPFPVKGAGKATAAIIISSTIFGLWILSVLLRIASPQ